VNSNSIEYRFKWTTFKFRNWISKHCIKFNSKFNRIQTQLDWIEIQLKKKGMEIVAQCIENMLITSISHEFRVWKKSMQLQENTNLKRCTPFHSIQVKFQNKICFGMTRHLVHLKPIYPILARMLPWPLELAIDARSQMMVMNIEDHDKFAET